MQGSSKARNCWFMRRQTKEFQKSLLASITSGLAYRNDKKRAALKDRLFLQVPEHVYRALEASCVIALYKCNIIYYY